MYNLPGLLLLHLLDLVDQLVDLVGKVGHLRPELLLEGVYVLDAQPRLVLVLLLPAAALVTDDDDLPLQVPSHLAHLLNLGCYFHLSYEQ